MSFLNEFRTFAVRGNVVDMAVGIIIGAAFTGVVNSLVNDLLMPPLGVVIGGVGFRNLFFVLRQGPEIPGPYGSLEAAQAAGATTLNLGLFVNTLISFLLVAFAVFLLVRTVNRLRTEAPPPPPSTRKCPDCATDIPLAARRCPHCTSEIAAAV